MQSSSRGPGTWGGTAGKRVVLTGGTRGIGLAAAKGLAAAGADLTLVARDPARGQAAAEQVRRAASAASSTSLVDVVRADLGSQRDVRRLAAELDKRYEHIDVLVNNAGAVFRERWTTDDGVEATWALNHVAPWLLTNLLLDKLRACAPARVITTGSEASAKSHIPFDDLDGDRSWGNRASMARGFRRYSQTKLANLVFTMELAKRLEGSGVEAYCFHPGLVASGFNFNNGAAWRAGMALTRPFSRSPEKGAETLVWLATSPEATGQSGGYFFDMKRHRVPTGALEPGVQERLWEVTEQQVVGSCE